MISLPAYLLLALALCLCVSGRSESAAAPLPTYYFEVVRNATFPLAQYSPYSSVAIPWFISNGVVFATSWEVAFAVNLETLAVLWHIPQPDYRWSFNIPLLHPCDGLLYLPVQRFLLQEPCSFMYLVVNPTNGVILSRNNGTIGGSYFVTGPVLPPSAGKNGLSCNMLFGATSCSQDGGMGLVFSVPPSPTNATVPAQWKLSLPPDAYSGPAISPDGSGYVLSLIASSITKINTTSGTVAWSFKLNRTSVEASAVGSSQSQYASVNFSPDGSVVYFQSAGLSAISAATGAILWYLPLPPTLPLAASRFAAGGPRGAVSSSGMIYLYAAAPLATYNIYAVSPAGKMAWQYSLGGSWVPCAPLLVDDSTDRLYVPINRGLVVLSATTGGLQAWMQDEIYLSGSWQYCYSAPYISPSDSNLLVSIAVGEDSSGPWVDRIMTLQLVQNTSVAAEP
jgi:outer membrane protein assembly factor BamB